MKLSRFHITLAQPEDNQDICRLFRIPFTGEISLAMERQPDYFLGARVQYEWPETYVCRQRSNGHIAACFSVGTRNVFLNRRKTLLRFHSDLRIDPDYQRTPILFDMSSYLKEHVVLLEGFSQTVIFSDNKIMNALTKREYHERLRSVVPFYTPYGQFITHTIKLKKRNIIKNSQYLIRQAQKEDVSIMQKFFDEEASLKQFYPCYDFSMIPSDYYYGLTLENYFLAFEDKQLVGIVGVWDQQGFKQTRIVKYSNRLKLLKPFLNAYASLRGKFTLPVEGTKLNHVTLHTVVVKKNSSNIFGRVCEVIYEHLRGLGFEYMLCGLDTEDDLNKVFDDSYQQRIVLGSHYAVSYNQSYLQKIDRGVFYLETARI